MVKDSERVKEHAAAMAKKHGRPFQYLASNIKKDETEFPGRFTALVRPNPYVKISPDREFVESVERLCGRDTVRLN